MGSTRPPPGASHLQPIFLALLGAACTSTSATVVRLADAGAGTTTFYRCLLALPALIVLAVREQRAHGRRSLHDRGRAVMAGIFLGVDLVLWTYAIYDVGAGVATVLGNLQVVFVTVVAWVILKERPHPAIVISLPVVVVGILLVAGLGGHVGAGFHPVAGVLYGLGSSAAYTGFLLILRTSAKPSSHVAGPLADATAGAVLSSLVFGLVLGQFRLGLSAHQLGWLTVLALTSQVLGWWFIVSALPHLPAATVALLLLFQPAASLVLAAIVLSQRPTTLQLIGAGLVCGEILLATWTNRATTGTLTNFVDSS